MKFLPSEDFKCFGAVKRIYSTDAKCWRVMPASTQGHLDPPLKQITQARVIEHHR